LPVLGEKTNSGASLILNGTRGRRTANVTPCLVSNRRARKSVA
jgi:hypothetical protein